jgi:hypothetical protein
MCIIGAQGVLVGEGEGGRERERESARARERERIVLPRMEINPLKTERVCFI